MKKILAILTVVLILSAMSVQVFAGPDGIIENPAISISKKAPTVDGYINLSEGWSEAALMNYDTLGFFWHVNPLTMDAEVRFAWDEEYFYYCADITDGKEAVHEITGDVIEAGYNSFIYSTGEDDIDRKTDGTAFGYNGDVFGLFIDPLGIFIDNGFVGGDDNTPWYLVGLFEGDAAKMYREKVNAGDITDKVKVAGHKTNKGWQFEAAIPWDTMIEDIDSISFGDCVIDKAQLFTDKALLRVGAMYHDRFNDPEAGEVSTWGCFVTVPNEMLDGTPGYLGNGTNVMSLGLTLNINNPSMPSTDTDSSTTTSSQNEETEVVTDEKGEVVTDEKGNKVTQKVNKTTTKKANTGSSTGGNAAQTFDYSIMIIVISIGGLVVSGIIVAFLIIGFTRKKRG